ncbi:MAG: hypothetical protein RIK87_10670 [Fuerstiella sp.]
MTLSGPGATILSIRGDYHQDPGAGLHTLINGPKHTALQVESDAVLDGVLSIDIGDGFLPVPGESYIILSASQITGRFANPENAVTAADGTRFTIQYSDVAVLVTVR